MNQNTICKLLNIEEIVDVKQIKKAYANQVKLHHPEEDPQGFHRLQEAYHEAQRYVKEKQTNDITTDHSRGSDSAMTEQVVEAKQANSFHETITNEEILAEIKEGIISQDMSEVMEALRLCHTQQSDQDKAFLNELAITLHELNIQLSYTFRKIFIDHFHLWEGEQLTQSQQQLLQVINKGIIRFDDVRLSRSENEEYLLNQWYMLRTSPYDDEKEWLSFLDEHNWNDDAMSDETIETLLQIELDSNRPHESSVAGRIYGFLRIAQHIQNDPKQLYARFQNLLAKDAPFTKQNSEVWKRKFHEDARLLTVKTTIPRAKAADWKRWLEQQHMDIQDIELQLLLSKRFHNCYFSKAIRETMINFFQLEQPTTLAQQALKDAILYTPKNTRAYQYIYWFIFVSGILITLLFMKEKKETEKAKPPVYRLESPTWEKQKKEILDALNIDE